ncbi:hypothetical protein [Sphingobium yanoikuyae]|uniref:UrcA family protein n=1 Tax=Sphingobium yanoikuyae TaxID=13690 RepID=A0A9X7U9F8_SPHYA|nr:hypothetical protein [Sphingobium yanoikuyae]QNG45755.1 hypothetical protein H3V42_29045 [Sphingobium yanoikuyae]
MHRVSLIAITLLAAWGGVAHAECLTRPISYAQDEEVSASSPRQAMVEVPSDEVTAYGAAGYVAASCADAREGSGTARIDGCAMADFGNEAVQKRLTALFGVEPAKICASTRKLNGALAQPQSK